MKKLLLVGAGHAHLYVLKQLEKKKLPDVEVTLVSMDPYEYHAELFAGYIEGIYQLEDIRTDAAEWAARAGANWIKGAIVSIDPEQKAALTEQGKMLRYDAISFDIGSLTSSTELPGVLENALFLKPNFRIPEVADAIQNALRPVIVGSDGKAVEIAFALHARRQREGKEPVVLISEGGLLEAEGAKMAEKAERIAKDKEMVLHLHDGAEAVVKNKIVTSRNRKISFDRLLWVPGSRPHQLFAASLPTDSEGYLLVEETLQVKSFPSVFGAGECVRVNGSAQRETSLSATLRQAQILWQNLNGFLGNGEGHLYRPKPAQLKIVAVGNERALLRYKDRVFYGKWPWRMKNRLDVSYVKAYQT